MSSNTYKSHPWLKKLALDETKWFTPAFSEFPSVIAHEYHRMLEMCHAEEPFGLLLQTKDLLECALKYQVLCICAWAKETSVPDFEGNVAIEITTESLSLGAWKTFAGKIRDFFNKSNFELPQPMKNGLETLLSFYEDYGIVTWRNEKIGHGALGFTEDDDFRSDICQKLLDIKTLFQKLFIDIKNQVICLEGKALFGYHNARDLEPKEGRLSIDCTGTVFCVEPYMILRNGNIFFFDNQKRSVTSQMQCYPNGRRINESNEYFRNLRRLLDKKGIDGKTGIDSEYMTNLEEEYLQHLTLEDHFVDPTFITDWLKKCLLQHDKGVFLLKMCRGTGKSTYTEKLNGLNKKPLVLANDLEVRTYHIQRSQELSASMFENFVENRWAQCYDNRRGWGTPPRMISYRLEEHMSPNQALAKFLEEAWSFYQKRHGRKRILFVLDGLDEINDDDIWSYIPAPDLLAKGVYILLVSRDPEQEELPQAFYEKLDRLSTNDELAVQVSAEENVGFLRAYLKKNNIVGLKKIQVQQLFELADYRVLYLGMLCKMLNDGMLIEQLPDAKNIIERYLDVLSTSYGGRYALLVREILIFLATWGVGEPLSLREIACVLGNGEITLELVGIMNDLMPLLKVQRGYEVDGQRYVGKNRYTIVNGEVAETIRELCIETSELVSRLIKETSQTIQNHYFFVERIKTEGEIEANVHLLILSQLENQVVREYDSLHTFGNTDEIIDKTIKYVDAIDSTHRLVATRVINSFKFLHRLFYWRELRIACEIEPENPTLTEKNAHLLAIHGSLLNSMGKTSEAIPLLRKTIKKKEELVLNGELQYGMTVPSAYRELAEALKNQRAYTEANTYYEKALSLRKTLNKASYVYLDFRDLAGIYHSFADLLLKQKKYFRALVYELHAIKIIKNLIRFGKRPEEWREELSSTYCGLAAILGEVKFFALADYFYRKSIAIFERIEKSGEPFDKQMLAVKYNNWAITSMDSKKYQQAEDALRKTELLLSQLANDGLLLDESSWGVTCNNLARVLFQLRKKEEAAYYEKKAMQILNGTHQRQSCRYQDTLRELLHKEAERLHEQGMFSDEIKILEREIAILENAASEEELDAQVFLAIAYDHMADALQESEDYALAVSFSNKAIKIWETLASEQDYANKRLLARSYFTLGKSLNEIEDYIEACKQYRKSIQLQEALHRNGELHDQRGLAISYHNLAWSMRKCKQYAESIDFFQKAIFLFEQLEYEEKQDNRRLLDFSYFWLAETLHNVNKSSEAIVYFEKAISIEEELDSKNLLEDRNSLAITYHNLACVLGDINMYAEAISYYRKAIAVREQLYSYGNLLDSYSLAGSYHNLAYDLNRVGDYIDAIANYKKAIVIREQLLNEGKLSNKNGLARSYFLIADVYHSLNDNEEALLYLERAIPLYEKLLQDGELKKTSRLQECYDRMGTVLDALNRKDEAEYYRQKAHQLAEDSNTASC